MERAALLLALAILPCPASAGPYADALADACGASLDCGSVEAQALAALAAVDTEQLELAAALASAEVRLEAGGVCSALVPEGCAERSREASLLLLARARLAEETGRPEHAAWARMLLDALERRNATCEDLPLRLLALRALHQATMDVRLASLCQVEWAGYAPASPEDGAWAALAALRLSETTGNSLARARALAEAGAPPCAPPAWSCSPREAGLWLLALGSLAGSTRESALGALLAPLASASLSLCLANCSAEEGAALAAGLAVAGPVLARPALTDRSRSLVENLTGCPRGLCASPRAQAWAVLAERALAMKAPYPAFLGFRSEGLRMGEVSVPATSPTPSPSPPPQAWPPYQREGLLAIVAIAVAAAAALLWRRARGAGPGPAREEGATPPGKGAAEGAKPAAPGGGPGGAEPEGKGPRGAEGAGRDEGRRQEFSAAVEYICRRLLDGYSHDDVMGSLEAAGYDPQVAKEALAFSLNEYAEGRVTEGETREEVRASLLGRGFPPPLVDAVLEEDVVDYATSLLHRGRSRAELLAALVQAGYDEGEVAAAFAAATDRFHKDLLRRGIGDAAISEKLKRLGF
jgi:hypothetical protein